jgi:hypothetical protein
MLFLLPPADVRKSIKIKCFKASGEYCAGKVQRSLIGK